MLGIDVRQSDKTGATKVIIRASIFDSTGAPVTTGTTNLRLAKVAIDGTLTFWNVSSATWQTIASEIAMTYRGTIAGQTGFGIWTVVLDAGDSPKPFSEKGIYIANIYNASGYPAYQEREFQYAGQDGDDYLSVVLTKDGINWNLALNEISVTTALFSSFNVSTGVVTFYSFNPGSVIDVNVTEIAGDTIANPLEVNLVEINGETDPVDKLEDSISTMILGEVVSSPSVTGFTSDISLTQTDVLLGRIVLFLTGDSKYKAVEITGYETGGVISTSEMEVSPEVGDTFIVI